MADKLAELYIKKHITLIFILVLVLIAIVTYLCVQKSLPTSTSWDDVMASQKKIDAVRRISVSDIKTVAIVRSGTTVILDPKIDGHYVAVLLDSLKHARTENTKHGFGYKDRIAIILKRNERKTERLLLIVGCFDPENAPVISRSMRSDDLGKIVYDIFRHKGIKPKRR